MEQHRATAACPKEKRRRSNFSGIVVAVYTLIAQWLLLVSYWQIESRWLLSETAVIQTNQQPTEEDESKKAGYNEAQSKVEIVGFAIANSTYKRREPIYDNESVDGNNDDEDDGNNLHS